MAEAGRGGRPASILAEEGRFREAAELNEKTARSGIPEHSFWNMVEWAANLEGAGLHDEALAVFGELLDRTRRKAAGQRTALAILTWELVHLSRMRETAGHRADAAATRREAVTVLEEAATGEPKNWSCILAMWVTLFALSGRADEPAATTESPMPPFGTDLGWSSDTRDAFLGALPGLEAEAVRPRGAGRLPELDDMLHTVLRRRANGESVEQIQLDLIIPTGKRKGQSPSVASIYRALAEHAKREAYLEAVEQAHADFAALKAGELPGPRTADQQEPVG